MGQPNGGLARLLAEHGVADRGVRLYLALCREGPQTAAELARSTGIHRVEAYRHIQLLEDSGILTKNGGRPMRFAAVPPEALVDRWIRRATERLRHLESDREHVLADWQESLEQPSEGAAPRFTVLEGPEKIHRFLNQRIGAAREEIRVAVGGFSLARAIDGGVDRALRAAAKRGVKVRVVTEVSVGNLAEAKLFEEFSDLRHASGPVSNRSLVIDKTGALVYVSGAEGLGASDQHQVALWSNAPSFQKLARDYHQRLWAKGEKAEERIVELEAPVAATLPVLRGRESESIDRLREVTALGMRISGVAEMTLDLPEIIGSIGKQLGREVARAIEGDTAVDVARSLQEYYRTHAMGHLDIVKQQPLVLRVTQCFGCVRQSPEVGRVLCPELLRAALEARLGVRYSVSKPNPRRHAERGCVFTATAG